MQDVSENGFGLYHLRFIKKNTVALNLTFYQLSSCRFAPLKYG